MGILAILQLMYVMPVTLVVKLVARQELMLAYRNIRILYFYLLKYFFKVV
jgi:hypothetical protein